MAFSRRHIPTLALLLGALSACVAPPHSAVFRSPPAPSVIGTCPQHLVQQSQWLMANLTRVQLGSTKDELVRIVGQPAHAESFMLTSAEVIEVFYYHTTSTVCRSPDTDVSLMPFIFQSNRLLGYGQNYYHNFIVPSLRAPAAQPIGALPPQPDYYQPGAGLSPATQQLPAALARGYAGQPDMQEEIVFPASPSGRVGRGTPLNQPTN